MEFSSKTVAERIYLGWKVGQRLDATETVVSAVFSIRAVNCVDHAPTAMLVGSSIIDADTKLDHTPHVKMMVINGVAGNTYELSAVIVTSGGRTLQPKSTFKVV